jgi:DNA-binding HxlR family transcriptional regulator
MGGMGSSAKNEYCAFTKAVEHLGDRWSFLIVRELAMFGPQGFNTLAAGLPGQVSRSVLARRMRKLEELGLVARVSTDGHRSGPYRLAPAGERLVPTLQSLWQWAERWVPEDPALAKRDPSVILFWLQQRVDRGSLPAQQVAVEFGVHREASERGWLLMSAGAEPELCQEDPRIDEERYVYVEADADALDPIARGLRSWADALADRTVRLYGNPELVAALPTWFIAPPAQEPPAPPDRQPQQRGRRRQRQDPQRGRLAAEALRQA